MVAKIQLSGSYIGLTTLLLFVLIACKPDPNPTLTVDPTQISVIPRESQHCELVNVVGEVEIFSADSSSSRTVTDTTPVQCGEEILLKQGAVAGLNCNGLDSYNLVAGITHSINCSQNGIPKTPCYADHGCPGFGTGQGVGSPEREEDKVIPYIIEPRATLLLEQPTIFRWHPVEGASEYEVTVRGGDLKWVTTTTNSEISYMGNPLKPGVDYTFEVTTFVTDDIGESLLISSQDEGVPGLGFALLSSDNVADVQRAVDNIQQTSLTFDERTIAEYNLYLSYGLNMVAIHLLDSTINSGIPNPALLQLQGQSYQNVALLTEAELAYLAALEQAVRVNDLNIIGQSSVALGLLLCGANNADQVAEGVGYLETAVSTYEQLGYGGESNRLNQEIETCRFSEN